MCINSIHHQFNARNLETVWNNFIKNINVKFDFNTNRAILVDSLPNNANKSTTLIH